MKRIIHRTQGAKANTPITEEMQRAADAKSNDLYNLSIRTHNLMRHDKSQTSKSFTAFYQVSPLPNGTVLLCEETTQGELLRHETRNRVLSLFEEAIKSHGKPLKTLTLTF